MKDFHKNHQEKDTSLKQSMPQSAKNDTYNFCKNDKKCAKNLNLLRKPRVFKPLAASGLALFMGIGTLCGVLLIPINAAQASVGGGDMTTSSTVSPFGLEPENDPVLYTTESGLDIKFAAETLSSGVLSGYTYFTMGSYEGTEINWVIIGRHSSTTSGTATGAYAFYPGLSLEEYYKEYPYGGCAYFENWFANEKETTTPAGVKIDAEWEKQVVIIDNSDSASINITLSSNEATSEIIDTELNPTEVLVISEKNICNSIFGGNHDYESSTLKSKMTSLFESELNFTDAQKKLIIPQYLTTFHKGTSYTSSAYLFALAGRGENFSVANYFTKPLGVSYTLGTTTATRWHLRSGYAAYGNCMYYVETDGSVISYNNYSRVGNSFGVRPAFVLQL